MRAAIQALVLVVLGLSVETAFAADDIMAMRGDSDSGRTHVNYFQPGARHTTDNAVVDTVPAAVRSSSEHPGIFQWRNNCLQNPAAIFGRGYEFEWQNGFGQVVPYTKKPTLEGSRFIDALAEELTGG